MSPLSAVGGSMPASARLNQRQAASAARTISSSFPSTRQIASGDQGEGEVPVGRNQESQRVFRRRALGAGSRKERNRTYGQLSRSFRSHGSGGEWVTRTFGLGPSQTARGAGLTAVGAFGDQEEARWILQGFCGFTGRCAQASVGHSRTRAVPGKTWRWAIQGHC